MWVLVVCLMWCLGVGGGGGGGVVGAVMECWVELQLGGEVLIQCQWGVVVQCWCGGEVLMWWCLLVWRSVVWWRNAGECGGGVGQERRDVWRHQYNKLKIPALRKPSFDVASFT